MGGLEIGREILAMVAKRYGLTPKQVIASRKFHSYRARAIAIYLMYLEGLTRHTIGKIVNREQSSVTTSIHRTRRRLDDGVYDAAPVEDILNQLKRIRHGRCWDCQQEWALYRCLFCDDHRLCRDCLLDSHKH